MSNRQQERVSRAKQKISELKSQVDRDVESLLGLRPFVKGSLYRWEHTCGKENCHCAQGELHVHWVLSYYEKDGKLVKVYVTPEEAEGLRKPLEEYQEFRKTRTRLIKKHRQLLPMVRDLENALSVEWTRPKKKGKDEK